MASELESDLLDWGSKWFVNLNAGNTQFTWFDYSINSGIINMKWMGLFLNKNHFSDVDLSLLNWNGALTLSVLLKLLQENWGLEVALYL